MPRPASIWPSVAGRTRVLLPLPGGPDRTADLVAALDGAGGPTLLVLEFQSEHDPDKLDVTLEEAAVLRCRLRHGDDRKGKYRVLTALVYLQGQCPNAVIDMTLPGEGGTRQAALVWNVGDDTATDALDAVAAGRSTWGTLFWVPLMVGGGDGGLITRWRQVVTERVSDRRTRGDLAGIARVFAELVGRGVEWLRGLEGFEMTESQVVNEWISQGEAKGRLVERRMTPLELLETRFPGLVPDEVVRLINGQESMPLLRDWFNAASKAYSFAQFLAVLRR